MSATQTMTNGVSSSKLIDHVTSYPVVSDGISTFKSNPYGAKSINLADSTYKTYVSPIVGSPYAQRPFGMVKPYVQKADSLASDGLTKVDKRFPIVKEDTEAIRKTLLTYVYAPFRLAFEGKDYVLDTYGSEYKKCGGDGYVSGGKALITTSMVVTSDTLAWLSSFVSQKKDQGKDFAGQKYQQAHGYASSANKYANDKSAEAFKYAQDKSEEARSYAYAKGDQAKSMAKDAQATGYEQASQAKERTMH